MRRKSFDVLFEPKQGMVELAKKPTMWRSLFYFVISVGAFIGVITNVIFADQSIAVRFAVLAGLPEHLTVLSGLATVAASFAAVP